MLKTKINVCTCSKVYFFIFNKLALKKETSSQNVSQGLFFRQIKGYQVGIPFSKRGNFPTSLISLSTKMESAELFENESSQLAQRRVVFLEIFDLESTSLWAHNICLCDRMGSKLINFVIWKTSNIQSQMTRNTLAQTSFYIVYLLSVQLTYRRIIYSAQQVQFRSADTKLK